MITILTSDGKKLRHELKYNLHPFECASLRLRLKSILTKDRYSVADDGYHIRSLYFDDMHDNALFEKNYGVINRKKYRIRIYNLTDKTIKLERKSKYGEYICKESASLTRTEYDQLMSGKPECLLERKEELLHQFYYGITVHGLRPRTVVDYTREAYFATFGDVRVTFDKGLATVMNTLDIFDEHATPMAIYRTPTEILEVKFTQFLPLYIRQMLDFRGSMRQAVSKYVLCREFMKDHYHL